LFANPPLFSVIAFLYFYIRIPILVALKPIHNEFKLLNEIAKGSEKAFAELFYAYHNQLGEFVLMLTNSYEMTEEIIQDVFVKVWLNREALTGIDKFTSYLFILTRNYTLNCIRKMVNDRKSKDQYDTLQLADAENLCTEVEWETDQDYQGLIDKAIAQLPPQQQKVFLLRQKGLKNPEIAKQINVSPQSVKKYQQWALKYVADFVKSNAALSGIMIIHSYLNK
jgi:RNA polymerase sigma-70 factor (family 1)